MSDEEAVFNQKIYDASRRYQAARSHLLAAFPPLEEDGFYAVTSAAEEFGAAHTRSLIQKQPETFGVPQAAFPTPEAQAELERRLLEYVAANEAMDWAVAEKESTRAIPEADPVKVLAMHGRIAELRLKDLTASFADQPERREFFSLAPVNTANHQQPRRTRPRSRSR